MQAIVHKRSVTDLEKRWRPVLFPLELTLSGSAKPRVAPDKDTVEMKQLDHLRNCLVGAK